MRHFLTQAFIIALLIVIFIQLAHSQVLQYDTKITIDNDGEKVTEIIILIQINNKQENWLSHVEINHDPKQDFSFNYARLIDSDGEKIKKFKKRDLVTRSDLSYQAFYQDDLITEFDLYSNQYPYRLEYSYNITEKEFLSVCRWSPYIYKDVQILKSSLKVTIPTSYKVNIDQTGDFKYNMSTVDDENIYVWESNRTRKIKKEILSPPFRDFLPKVRIVPSQFKYGVEGSFDSWSCFGQWIENLNMGTDQLPDKAKDEIKELIDGIKSKRDIIKTLYKSMQDQTRYVNVAIDVGGLKSYPASYVNNNKYGDCKALTTYMKAMLNSVGVESYYTLVNAGSNATKINTDFPNQQFNHVILTIPVDGDTIWLENTSNILPYNYLGTFTQNRYALLVNGKESKLVKTPMLDTSDVLTQRFFKYHLSGNNRCEISVDLNLWGNQFEELIYSFINENDEEQRERLLDKIELEKFDLTKWEHEHHRDSSYIVVNTKGNIENPIRKFGRLKVINPFKIKIPDFEKPGQRKQDVRINYPINMVDTSVYIFVDSLDIQFPSEVELISPYGRYVTFFHQNNNQCVVGESFVLCRNEVPIKEYQQFYDFIQSIINYKRKSAILLK